MSITLLPDTERLVEERVQRGDYPSATALVDLAVRRLLDVPNAPTMADGPGISQYADLIGSFDSAQEPPSERHRSAMTEMVADKLERQGIDVPWRRH